MKKILIIPTILLALTMLVCGLYFPNGPLMWLSSTETMFAGLRLGITAILLALLFTKPPRLLWFRALLVVAAIALSAVTAALVYNYQLQILDAALFIEVSIIFAIEGLEVSRQTARPVRSPRPIQQGFRITVHQ